MTTSEEWEKLSAEIESMKSHWDVTPHEHEQGVMVHVADTDKYVSHCAICSYVEPITKAIWDARRAASEAAWMVSNS